jgi:Tat protein translocase TatB subunit
MFGVGPEELVLILIIALIVLGPERMPKVARDIGRVVGDLRRTSDELRQEFLNADKLLDKAADAAGPTTPIPSIPATAQTNDPRRDPLRSRDARGAGAAQSAARRVINP